MRLILACALAVSLLGAQSRPARKPAKPAAAAQTSWPVESIDIEGLHHYTREQVLAVVKLKPGQTATAKDFESARQRLLETGVFESAGMRYGPAPGGKGYVVTFELTEAGPLLPVRFEDLNAPEAKLREALQRADPFFGPKVPGTEAVISRYTAALEATLGGTKVTGKLEPDDNQQLSILFRPAAAPTRVARVRFTGNEAIEGPALENAVNPVAVGMAYREPRLRQILDNQLRPLYEARGRVRFTFPKIETEQEKDVKGLVVTVAVNEGESYSLGDLEVKGSTLTPSEMKKFASGVKAGGVFNIEEVQAAAVKIEKRMQRDGYMHVRSKLDKQIDDKLKKVTVVIHVEPGPLYTYARLDIKGLDILSEPEVRKMWTLQPGQPFDSDYPDHFLTRIREDGVFDNLGETKALIAPDDERRTVAVTLVFKGEPPKKEKKPWER
jgi:outer membrane protein insertion porin family